ncbi:hypothetical protein CGZ94_04870 [Enemella evansiae]|uniref:HTH cro/C1-type domain-containing protein n=1 Tax=Enemella evansiae TaxID=2016499 RepID=A0A255GKH9_9ACTN|nr:hypothetical protein CGZ94_04870 [Enemella evansiae]
MMLDMTSQNATPLHEPDGSYSTQVAAKVRARAAWLNITQADLARALGVSRTTISQRWRGVRPWGLDDLHTVAGVLKTTPWELARSEGFEPPTF